MKKLFTLILTVAAVASAVAVTPNRVVNAKLPTMKQVKVAQDLSKSQSLVNGFKLDKNSRKGIRRAGAADYTIVDSAYIKPAGTFYENIFSYDGKWGYSYGVELAPANTELTYKASTLGNNWEYFLSAWEEESHLASGSELTIKPEFSGVSLNVTGPYLTQDGDSIFQGPDVFYGGDGKIFDTSWGTSDGLFQSTFSNADFRGAYADQVALFPLSSKYYTARMNANNLWTNLLDPNGQYGVQATVYGIGEYVAKPPVPMTIGDITISAYLESKGNAELKAYIVPFDVENGEADFENPLAQGIVSYAPAADGNTAIDFNFEMSHFDADGMETVDPVLIDQDVLVYIDFSDDAIVDFLPRMVAYDTVNDDTAPETTAYTLMDVASETYSYGTFILTADAYSFRFEDDENAPYYRPYATSFGMHINYPSIECDEDEYVFEAEGEEKTITFNATEPASVWGIGDLNDDMDYEIPDWMSIESTDYTFTYRNSTIEHFAGEAELKITVDALPEDVKGRSFDLNLAINGFTKTIKIVQGEVEEESKPGDVNADGYVNATDLGIVVNIIAGLDEADNYDGRADLNGDNYVNATDLGAIVNIIAGISDEPVAEEEQ